MCARLLRREVRCDKEACTNGRGGTNGRNGVDALRREPRPYKVTKRALQKQVAFHYFYGVAADADVVDAVGGFAGADEEFAGAVGLDALADEDLFVGLGDAVLEHPGGGAA